MLASLAAGTLNDYRKQTCWACMPFAIKLPSSLLSSSESSYGKSRNASHVNDAHCFSWVGRLFLLTFTPFLINLDPEDAPFPNADISAEREDPSCPSNSPLEGYNIYPPNQKPALDEHLLPNYKDTNEQSESSFCTLKKSHLFSSFVPETPRLFFNDKSNLEI